MRDSRPGSRTRPNLGGTGRNDGAAPQRPHSLLVVDPSPAARRALGRELTALGQQPLSVATWREAGAILSTRQVDAVIAADGLGNDDGVAFLAWIRRTHPSVKRVLITGHCHFQRLREAVNEAGVWFFLTKPWDQPSLTGLVRSLDGFGVEDSVTGSHEHLRVDRNAAGRRL
ncbi:MAG: response regulator [Proteobacteria bacterium]|nr:response regulator [Pseudomonadota bacterium]